MTSADKKQSWLYGSLYPDRETPQTLDTLEDRVDFLVRLCGAWDFGILPIRATVEEVRRPEWTEAVDQCRMLTSPVYRLLRKWHGLERLPYLGRQLAYIRDDPFLSHVQAISRPHRSLSEHNAILERDALKCQHDLTYSCDNL